MKTFIPNSKIRRKKQKQKQKQKQKKKKKKKEEGREGQKMKERQIKGGEREDRKVTQITKEKIGESNHHCFRPEQNRKETMIKIRKVRKSNQIDFGRSMENAIK